MTFDEETDDSSRSSDVAIQTSAQSVPSTPSWLGEVAVIAHYLRHQGVLSGIEERVRFARRRFGHYDLIDFVLVLLGYAINGERTLEAFYERVLPFANVFMALFGRDRLPARSTLSRFLAALKQAPVEVLRTLFLEDLVARPLEKEEKPGGLWDRQGNYWVAFDVDGTRQAARQRALPCTPDLSPAHRRLDPGLLLLAISDASEGKLSGPGPPCSRPIHTNGSARFRRWKLYGEEGLARKSTVIWLYGDTLTLEYADTPLTQFTVHFQPDNKHFQQVMDSRQFETPYQSLQGHLWEPDVVEWRMAQRLPDYAPRKQRKRVLGYRQPCLMDDPQTEQG